MVYKFLFISDEEADFMREISIDAEATFMDLHNAILESVNYEKDAMTSFFICNEDWEKEQEITLVEMDTSADMDNYVMDQTTLEELITEEHQKVLYVFDYISDRAFFMELKEIVPGQNLDAAVCTATLGEAPAQYQLEDIESITKAAKNDSVLFEENFYGDEGFDMDELDSESFSDMNFDDDFSL
jgi:hypothetical protein